MSRVQSLGANRTQITLTNGDLILVSYKTPVAALISGQGYVKTEQRWSNTTSKHIGQFCDGTAKDVPTRPQEFFDTLLQRVMNAA